jgi:hypothetical protein
LFAVVLIYVRAEQDEDEYFFVGWFSFILYQNGKMWCMRDMYNTNNGFGGSENTDLDSARIHKIESKESSDELTRGQM